MFYHQWNIARRFGVSKLHLSPTPVALGTTRSKAVVLLLLIYCLLLLCLVLCYSVLSDHSSCCINVDGEERAGCFTLIVLLLFLRHGDVC